ncbi:hybrid sensor histidine kinase/response regulator [Halomonas daqiaonensis]|uniref:histidine kinase n=1 Tax=Halomonas daqiaonensis TaxID=650850 RepID=A0A1H7LXH4_9GAMM|nr:PAS domain S-box protein [Halomonas daqiaonensis]SEL03673.1 PAS domain S-box-containing protein [Halomonas daqiaonensis]
MRDDPGTRGHTSQHVHELLSFHRDNLPLAVIEWDSDFRIARWSRHAETLFGWPADAVIGLHPFDFAFVFPEDAEAVAEVIRRLLAGAEPQHVSTNRNLTRAGTLVECEWHNSIQLDDQCRVVSVLSVVHEVTERNAAERRNRELLAREQALKDQFRAIFESAPGLYLVLTADDYRIVGVSDAYLEATYTDREAIIGRQLFDVFPVTPDRSNAAGVEELSASLERVKRYGQPDTMPVLRYPIPDPATGGFEERYWSPINVPVFDEQQRLSLILHRTEDVTDYLDDAPTIEPTNLELIARARELKTLLERHRSSEEHWRRLFAEAATGIVQADTQGRFLYANQAFCDMVGYSEEELRATDFLALTHPDDRQTNTDELRRLLAGTTNSFVIEKRLLDYRGGIAWCRNSVSAQRDMHGTIVSLVAVIEDITAQREAETHQRSLAQRLTRSLENMGDAFYLLDENWCFSYLNHQAERVLKRSAAELLGHSVWDAFPEAQESELWACYHAAIESGEAQQFTFYFPPLAHWFEVNAYPGEEGLAVYFRTVTEKKRLEAQLQEAHRMEAIGHLTGGMAHDFNNLLTVVMGNADLLVEALADDTRLSPLAQAVADSAQRGADLTQRLLAFARRQALAPQPTDINRLIHGLTEMLRRTLGDQIELSFHPGGGLWSANIDPSQLESAILNLSINARDAMPDGGQLTIETRNTSLSAQYADSHLELAPGDYVCVAVSDTGTGIPEAIRERVFEPFFTTKEKGKGTGLGLSMVFGFLKQSAGHVNLYSEEGEGTTIKLYLPRIRQAAADPQPLPREESRLSGSETLLVVEDDEAVRKYVVAQLEAAGYGVRQAKDGPSALAILADDTTIALLFTDVMMPGGMTGRELAIAARRLRPDLKVVYTSGYTENAIVHNGRLDEGVRFLGKPYRPVALLKVIRETLDED